VVLAAEDTSQAAIRRHPVRKVSLGLLAVTLTGVSASCLLKYMWWTACYSAWSGIPKLAGQRRMAGANASFNGWGFILLEISALATFYSLIQFRRVSRFPRLAARITISLILMAAGTTAFALLLSMAQIGVR
jgi:hypothetical protein